MKGFALPQTALGWIALLTTVLYGASWIAFLIDPSLKDAVHGIPVLGPMIEVFFVAYFIVAALWLAVKMWAR